MSIIAHLPSTLILWDVDHTLIENGGVSKATYASAFELLTGRAPSVRPVTDGRTDFEIMHELLSANSVDAGEYVEIAQFEGVLVEAMKRNMSQLPQRGHILPGVVEVLALLSALPGAVQSVLTGNIASNARAKLSAFSLDGWVDFDVGGFGSDGTTRSSLVGVARRKALKKYGATFDQSSTVLVGDTPLDIKAARDGGARIIAVATGVYSASQLAEAGADVTLDSLADTDRFMTALVSLRAGLAC
ncbi:MAG: haloacid dehalogenase-like hydrolase [Pseudonocardiales bacterium]|nr:haloacid dehalogenase-like hydrolase [Pseudonocardiales bacterium]